LFDVDVDGGFRESNYTVPGRELVLVRGTPFGAIGLSTCYDVRFAEVYTAYCRAGADLILVPSAFMPTTGKAHWETLLRARAIETQVVEWWWPARGRVVLSVVMVALLLQRCCNAATKLPQKLLQSCRKAPAAAVAATAVSAAAVPTHTVHACAFFIRHSPVHYSDACPDGSATWQRRLSTVATTSGAAATDTR
jgi:apolipoprotein N-acyltransferase